MIHKEADDVIYSERKTLREKLKYLYYMSRCRALVQCNVTRRKFKRSQLSLYLSHGSPIKAAHAASLKGSRIDYACIQSHSFDDMLVKYLNGRKEQFIYTGFPRCDYFYAESKPEAINEIVNGKYIIWLPTFRIHRCKTRDDAPGSVFNHIGVPLFYDIQNLRDFNSFLIDMNIHILYKPHFAQDMDIVKRETLSNFHMIHDPDILGRNLQLYEVIAHSEALITDYSSVFWDYLLLDRPIALTIDDVESYRKGLGFAVDFDAISSEASERLSDSKELREFVLNVIHHRDIMCEGRRKWRDIGNMHQDGKSAERTAEFIKSMLK